MLDPRTIGRMYLGTESALDGAKPTATYIVDMLTQRYAERFGEDCFRTCDVVGIDTGFHAAEVMAEGFPDRMRHPFKGISQMMFEANRYGQKNGIGFYKYEEDKRGKPKKTEDETALSMAAEAKMNSVELSDDDILARMMIPMCIETVRCLDESIVGSAADADMGLIMGIGFPVFRGGAMRYIDQMGVKAFVEMADRYADLGKLYQVTDSLREMAAKGESFFK